MIEQMDFGKTGHRSSRVIFGGAALRDCSQEEADRVLDILLEYDVNHIDVARSYGYAELRIGPWMTQYRQRFFLATKTGARSYQEARGELHESLERLQTDQIDMIQMHHLIDSEDWEQALGPGGALEALVEARDEGLVRFVAVTGHGFTAPRMHLKSLKRFSFDAVLLPCNFLMMQDPAYASDFNELAQYCADKKVAVQTIKAIARRPWLEKRQRNTWYEPFDQQQDVDRAVHWVLAHPDLFLISAADKDILPLILKAAAQELQPATDEEIRDMYTRQKGEYIYEGSTALMK